MLQQVSSLLLQFSIVVFLTHALSIEDFGRYAVAILLPGVLAMASTVGMPAANIYALGRGASIRAVLWWDARVGVVALSAGLALSVGIVAGAATTLFPGVPTDLLWVAICGFPAALAHHLMTSLLRGRQDFRRYNFAMVANPAVALLAALLLVWGFDLGSAGAVAAWVIGQSCGFAASAWFVRGHCRNEMWDVSPEQPTLAYGLKAHLSNILTFLNYRIDIFLVNYLVGPAGAGIYTAAVRVAEQLWLVSNAVATVLLPRLSHLHRDEEIRRRLTPLLARWVTLIGLGMALVLALTMDLVVEYLFGPGYVQAATVLWWLLPGIVIFNCTRILGNDLAARGRPDLNAWTAALSLAVNIAGNILLIPLYGIIGAALATTLSYSLTTLVTILLYTRLSGNRARDVVFMNRTDWELVTQALRRAPTNQQR